MNIHNKRIEYPNHYYPHPQRRPIFIRFYMENLIFYGAVPHPDAHTFTVSESNGMIFRNVQVQQQLAYRWDLFCLDIGSRYHLAAVLRLPLFIITKCERTKTQM